MTTQHKIRGFTFIEASIAIGVVAIIGTAGIGFYLPVKNTKALDSQASQIAAYLRGTIERSRSQENSSQWGVHFTNPAGVNNDYYEIWYGSSYPGTIVSKIFLSSKHELVDPVSGTSRDMVFAKQTGLPVPLLPTSVTITSSATLGSGPKFRTVTVSSISRVDITQLGAPPSISSFNPMGGVNSGSTSITINGSNFVAGSPSTTAKLRKGVSEIICQPFASVTSTALMNGTCNIQNVAAGAWEVVVANPDGQSASASPFTITNAPPTTSSITPSSGIAGTTVSVTRIDGTRFLAPVTVKLKKEASEINCGTFPVTSQTQLGTGSCTIPSGTAIGGWSVVAVNGDGQSGNGATFTINPTPNVPIVTTSAATDITSSMATFYGLANPNGSSTTSWFRYSTTNPGICDDTFGTRLPATTGDTLGSGSSDVEYSRAAYGLTASTTYYFCAVASNAYGTGYGVLLSFETIGVETFAWRRRVTVNNQNATTYSDFQVKIIFDTATLISQGKMRSDCGDLRVRDTGGVNDLPYWIDADFGCNHTYTSVWTKLPSLPASGSRLVYLYYSNSVLTSKANGDGVFRFFEDFSSGTISPTKWYVSSGTAGDVVDVQGTDKHLRIIDDGVDGMKMIQTKRIFSPSFRLGYDIQGRYSSYPYMYGFVLTTSDRGVSPVGSYHLATYNGVSGGYAVVEHLTNETDPPVNSREYSNKVRQNAWVDVGILMPQSVNQMILLIWDFVTYSTPYNGWRAYTSSTLNTNSAGPLYLNFGGRWNNNIGSPGSSSASEIWVDEIKVHAHSANDPTDSTTVEAEEPAL